MEKSIQEKIIDYLRRNRVSTTEVADALGKTGAIKRLRPVNPRFYKVGVTIWIYACDSSNYTIHEQIQDIEEGHVIIAHGFDCEDRALFGELVSKYLLLYRQSEALVACGNLRDAAMLMKNNYPIWCEGFNPEGCFNNRPKEYPNEDIIVKYKEKYNGAIAVCDDCGVVLIPKNKINEDFLQELDKIEKKEDLWFDLLDHKKKNTFDIVCK